MSKPNAPQDRIKIFDVIKYHVKRPHGIAFITLLIFVGAWIVWTFVILPIYILYIS